MERFFCTLTEHREQWLGEKDCLLREKKSRRWRSAGKRS
jgi:hypothetical protein